MAEAIHPVDDASTRERLLDVALTTFAERGYDGASTREIAARADVNRGLIPYYFGNKEALWRAAVDRAFEDVHAFIGGLFAPVEDAASERDAFADLIRSIVRFAASHPAFNRLMTEEGRRDGPRLEWMVERHLRPMYEAVVARAESARANGILASQLDPALVYHVVVGATTHVFHQAPEFKRLSGRDATDDELIERHSDALVALFVGESPEESER